METNMQRFTVACYVAGQAMRFTRDENGATAIEYAIIVAMFTLIAGLFS